MKLQICKACKTYTLKDTCPECKSETEKAGYKYIKFKSSNIDIEVQ